MEQNKFDYDFCRRFLDERVAQLRPNDGRFDIVHNINVRKPNSVISFAGCDLVAQFSVWSTGECDYEVHKAQKMRAHEWGLTLDNGSLSEVFDRFIERVYGASSSPN